MNLTVPDLSPLPQTAALGLGSPATGDPRALPGRRGRDRCSWSPLALLCPPPHRTQASPPQPSPAPRETKAAPPRRASGALTKERSFFTLGGVFSSCPARPAPAAALSPPLGGQHLPAPRRPGLRGLRLPASRCQLPGAEPGGCSRRQPGRQMRGSVPSPRLSEPPSLPGRRARPPRAHEPRAGGELCPSRVQRGFSIACRPLACLGA